MEAVRTSETSVDNYFTRQYIPEDNFEHHTRRRENLKSHTYLPRQEFLQTALVLLYSAERFIWNVTQQQSHTKS
jgi:hypothetical protein